MLPPRDCPERHSPPFTVTYPPFGIRAKFWPIVSVVSYCLYSIKLAGSTTIVIHYFVVTPYFEYVISYKYYFVLHLFSDSTSTPIHFILHLLFHFTQCLLFFLLVVGWASHSFFLFIILWLLVQANPLLPSYLIFPIFVSCPKFVADVYYWEIYISQYIYIYIY